MTINNYPELSEFGDRNEIDVNTLPSNNWRASLVPAAAVIPAPIVYAYFAVVEKLVVGFLYRPGGLPHGVIRWASALARWPCTYFTGRTRKSGLLL